MRRNKTNVTDVQQRLYEEMNPVYFKIDGKSYLFCESYDCILKVPYESDIMDNSPFDIDVLDMDTGELLGTVKFKYPDSFDKEEEKELSIKLVHDITKYVLSRPKYIVWNSNFCQSGLYANPSKGEIEVTTNCELREKLDE